jgi:Uma2 family endonuclease
MLRAETRPLTVHDFRELPEGPPYYQLIEGDLYMVPSPDLFHQDILLNVAYLLRRYLEKHPIGTVHIAPSDVELSDLNVYEPDIYFVAESRKSILTKQGATGAPNLVVEVLSPKTAKHDKGTKRSVYARAGVEELWMVDPQTREVLVYQFQKSADLPAATYGEKQKFESRLFPGLKIPVAKIFKQ